MRIRNVVLPIVAICACLPAMTACTLVNNKPVESKTPVVSPTPSASPSSSPTPSASPTPSTYTFVYTDAQYGFQLTFPNWWQGMKVTTDDFGSGVVNAQAMVGGNVVGVDAAQFTAFHPDFAINPDIQPVVIIIIKRADWDSFDDVPDEPGDKEVVTSAGGPEGSTPLAMNSAYVFTEGTRQYGFAYDTGINEAQTIAESLVALNR